MTERAIVERVFVRVAGPDAASYLQGQLSQDMGIVGRGEPAASFLLDPTGKVVALLRVVREAGDVFVVDTDAAAADATVARLRRFLLRTKATIEVAEGWICARLFDAPSIERALAVPWPGAGAPVDVTGPDAETAGEVVAATPLDDGEYHRRRILAGVPVSGIDIGPDTIPLEAGRWAVEAAVSFTKGCYTGQELVARIDSRGGNVPRPLRVLRFEGSAPPAGSAVIGPDGKEVGRITSASADVALAPVARRLESGAAVTAAGASGTVLA